MKFTTSSPRAGGSALLDALTSPTTGHSRSQPAKFALGRRLADKYGLTLRDVNWHPAAPGSASQVEIPVVGVSWFDPIELELAGMARHGDTGSACAACGRWRWLPLGFGMQPTLRVRPGLDGVPIAASPEWFGDGGQPFREMVVRRDLAEEIAAASPRDFKVQEIDVAD